MELVIKKGSVVPLLLYEPPATHSQFVTQETPATPDAVKSALDGVLAANVHPWPFQTNAKGLLVFVAVSAVPMAVHVVMLTQSTALRTLSSLVDEFGLVATVHAVPPKLSTSVWNVPDAFVVPTAWQKEVPIHDTPLKEAMPLAGSVSDAPGTMAHPVPFHCSIRGTVEVPDVA